MFRLGMPELVIIKILAPPCEAFKEGWPRIKKKERYL
jgi:hypothetical protein